MLFQLPMHRMMMNILNCIFVMFQTDIFGDFVFDGLKEKALMRIEGPLGSYFLRENSNRPIILMGGGTGFCAFERNVRTCFSH